MPAFQAEEDTRRRMKGTVLWAIHRQSRGFPRQALIFTHISKGIDLDAKITIPWRDSMMRFAQ
jgi:hypothetical protein